MSNVALSPYKGKDVSQWSKITERLINKHPVGDEEIVQVVLKSWNDIFNSSIGLFFIGKEIFPSPQIMSFFLHELVAHNLSLIYPGIYKTGIKKDEKDVHCIKNPAFSIEIKASSHPNQIFANRSYAQPASGKTMKNKDGFYITINFEKFDTAKNKRPEILLIRFGYIEHSDWIAQNSATGQQARLSLQAYSQKLKVLYPKPKTK